MNSNLLLQAANKNRSDTKFSEKNFTRHYNIGDLIVENGRLKICTNVNTIGATFNEMNEVNVGPIHQVYLTDESIYNVRED